MSGLALPGEPCGTELLPDWTPQEKWVWECLCRGTIADFNAAEDYGGGWLDPKTPEGWPEGRVLRPEFLETVLLHEPYRSALPRQGVRISGARFIDTLDLSNATLAHQLWLDHCRFEAALTLARVQAPSLISLAGSTFTGKLDMNSLQVEGSLFMREQAQFAEVVLRGAKVGDQLDMSSSTFTGKLDMNSLQVGGQLDMSSSTFTGKLDMDSLQVEGSLFMRNARVTSDDEVGLIFAKISGDLDISGCELPSLNLTGTQVREDFRLGSEQHPPVRWRGGARLTLRNTAVGALQDRPEPGVNPKVS